MRHRPNDRAWPRPRGSGSKKISWSVDLSPSSRIVTRQSRSSKVKSGGDLPERDEMPRHELDWGSGGDDLQGRHAGMAKSQNEIVFRSTTCTNLTTCNLGSQTVPVLAKSVIITTNQDHSHRVQEPRHHPPRPKEAQTPNRSSIQMARAHYPPAPRFTKSSTPSPLSPPADIVCPHSPWDGRLKIAGQSLGQTHMHISTRRYMYVVAAMCLSLIHI